MGQREGTCQRFVCCQRLVSARRRYGHGIARTLIPPTSPPPFQSQLKIKPAPLQGEMKMGLKLSSAPRGATRGGGANLRRLEVLHNRCLPVSSYAMQKSVAQHNFSSFKLYQLRKAKDVVFTSRKILTNTLIFQQKVQNKVSIYLPLVVLLA